jgi:peptidoglycan/LPS O-acetylase OafA/YrhL
MPKVTNRPTYRPDIDGLRAVAVLAVIANHIAPQRLLGGYIGVDIFFVISGFVITASLASRPVQRAGSWLSAFYARRVQRLAPALLACVLITAVTATLVIPAVYGDYDQALQTGLSAIIGVSNISLYLQKTNYFGDDAQLLPFTHTWSLGVEEQFYLVFPLLVLLSGISNQRRRAPLALGLLVGILSLISAQQFFALQASDARAAYFLMPPRF